MLKLDSYIVSKFQQFYDWIFDIVGITKGSLMLTAVLFSTFIALLYILKFEPFRVIFLINNYLLYTLSNNIRKDQISGDIKKVNLIALIYNTYYYKYARLAIIFVVIFYTVLYYSKDLFYAGSLFLLDSLSLTIFFYLMPVMIKGTRSDRRYQSSRLVFQ